MTHPDQERAPAPLLRGELRKILVFRALQLGDMLCAVPALRALRLALPHARITLIGLPWAAQFADRFPRYIDDFLAFPGHPTLPEQPVDSTRVDAFYAQVRAMRADLAIQLHGSGAVSNGIVKDLGARLTAGFADRDSPGFDADYFLPFPATGAEPLRLLRLTTLLGARHAAARLEFPLTRADWHELRVSGLARGLAPGRYICVHPGARSRDKCWPPDRFAIVADTLAAQFKVAVVLTGSAAEADLTAAVRTHMRCPAHDAAQAISIGAMAALMAGARLVVCNDTGVSHIAAGLAVPSVVIFGKADMARWAPLDRDRHRCLWDPDGREVVSALAHARALMLGH